MGIYYINIETFIIQIIVTRQLPPDENLYLHCLTNDLLNAGMIERLANDYFKQQRQDIYTKYLNQLTTTNNTMKGGSVMICEGLLTLFGTSSEEIIAIAKKESEAQINELSKTNRQLTKPNKKLSKTNR